MRRNDGKSLNYRKHQGGWLNLVLGAASLFLGAKASKSAEKRADTDSAQSYELEGRRLDLAEKQDERSGQLFDQYMELYAPREEELLSEAFDRPISPAAAEARATTDVRSSLETAREMGDRNMRRLGVNPNSGAYVGLDRARELGGAKIEAGARTRARESTRDLNFGRQASVVGMGRGLPITAAGYSGQATAGFAGAASLAEARAADSNALAQQAGAGYGNALGDFVQTAADWWKNRKTPPVEDYGLPEGYT